MDDEDRGFSYDYWVEKYKEVVAERDALLLESNKWKNAYETESKLRRQDYIECDVLRKQLEEQNKLIDEWGTHIHNIEEWLKIAKEAFRKIKMETGNGFHMQVFSIADNALAEIEKKGGEK